MKRPATSTAVFSEENRERFYRVTEFSRKVAHYGWIPFIMLIGYIRSDPRPSLLRLLNPLS